jgi:hypothetical protein
MKARIIFESASLEPDELKVAFEAFDSVWQEIAGRYVTPEAVERARTRLATLILSLMSVSRDASDIQAIAVKEMTKPE